MLHTRNKLYRRLTFIFTTIGERERETERERQTDNQRDKQTTYF